MLVLNGRRLVVLLLRLLGIAGARLGLAERTDWRIPVDLLVAGQTGLHGRRLLAEIHIKVGA